MERIQLNREVENYEAKKGKITAVRKGTTTIYVYARNGLTKSVKVKVK
ncbi:MAG: hypothetical protein K6G85_04665 [Eubacterium sp.]|nr:hypothetical protein [Eubacterium sp.]